MQSSARNCLNVRLKVSTHSPSPRRAGESGAAPRSVVAVDKGERAELRLRRPFAATAGEKPHRRAEPAREEEARPERTCGDERQLRAELPADVRCVADAGAEIVDRARELLALGLDVAPNLLRRSSVSGCHCSSAPPKSVLPPQSPAPERAGFPCGSCRAPACRAGRRAGAGCLW